MTTTSQQRSMLRYLLLVACFAAVASFTLVPPSFALTTTTSKGASQRQPISTLHFLKTPSDATDDEEDADTDTAVPRLSNHRSSRNKSSNIKSNDRSTQMASLFMGILLTVSTCFAGTTPSAFAAGTTDMQKYDGFAEYAAKNQMEKSDVACFAQQCGAQTKALFSSPRGIKGVSCLGRCKGEQSCAMRCFAEFGSESLNNWLSCTIEENECVKVPKNIDNSAENVGYSATVKNFDPASLTGTWYKTDGLNPDYDLFDCQTNTFTPSPENNREVDMGIFFRVNRPEEAGGGFWENSLTEHMVVDAPSTKASGVAVANADAAVAVDTNDMNSAGRTMHTAGKMNGLIFSENWYILGESDGKGDVPAFKLVAYKGHTLQGNYEGAFVYAKEALLPAKAVPAVRSVASKAGLNFDKFTRIDNTCPTGEALNDAGAGTGTSTTDWIDLVVGEGGVIDWISPGWRGEYKK